MPDWLAEYRPELWSLDPSDDVERYYFGRFRWEDAREEWAAGGNPRPYAESPRPVAGASVYTSSMGERSTGGSPRQSRSSRIEES